ncbi:SIR2 family protein [Porphyromonas gulae]|uniref:Sir2 family NAD-dependent protein deacetylase n=2 Tax=Porphyromonas gulae TaxID=111105 RepID=A0A0A2F957_9PORP|nr:SIR2 family protein [Porphyromonas gulae]KGN86617.1 Sir2 family NAD-dependent protein deacetylase [Porphyromonas gulae]KGN87151.1 Sir2 family NAD-dependent protein deacetylase [Porphyromonas gulae]KGN87636.1 Sir2 family NAD-dependent protein deacetylase [Porphyromonas gulae]
MEDNLHYLKEDYKKGRLILFVGAGVSANLGLPTWSKLIDHLADDLGYDSDVFKTYGNFLALAEYYRIKKGNLKGLTDWMCKEFNDLEIDISVSEIHKSIANGNFPIVYTTNYDNLIEMSYDYYNKGYTKIVKVSDISESTASREIVKFHGDFSDENSIVLGETSYYQRLQFETPLDIKLRADVLGKSVLFIGYSLQDINIRHLFYRLTNLWNNYGGGSKKPQSYIFSSRDNPIQEEVMKQWGIQTINSRKDDPSEALRDFLRELVNDRDENCVK